MHLIAPEPLYIVNEYTIPLSNQAEVIKIWMLYSLEWCHGISGYHHN